MRSTLSELPVFIACLWGGLVAGFLTALLRLPGKLYAAGRRGRRSSLSMLLLSGTLDVAAAVAAAVIFAATTVYANGGELRLYAVCAYALGLALPGSCAAAIIRDRIEHKTTICDKNKQHCSKTNKNKQINAVDKSGNM